MDRGGDNFDVKITDAEGNDVPFELKDNEDGTYKVNYTPHGPGEQKVAINLREEPIKNSPMSVMIAPAAPDASKCLAYGPGLEKAEIGQEAPFTVEMRGWNGERINSGGQNLAVKVTGPFGDVPAEQKDNSDGTHSVSYKPLDVGSYKVEITVDDQAVADSPYTVEAHAPEGAAWHENSYAEGPGLEDGNTTAEPTHYTIYTVDKDGNPCTKGGAPIDVEIMGPECEPVDADVKDNEDGTYTVTYHPTEAGEYTIENVLRNPFQPMHFEHIKNSPKTVEVLPSTDSGASYAYGPGLEDGIQDTVPTEFTIQAADKHGNKMDRGGDNFDVKITDAEGNDVPFELKDNEDGTYKVNYTPHGPGEQKVAINLREEPIKNSPMSVMIAPAAPDASKCLAYGPGLEKAEIGQEAPFTVEMRGWNGERINSGGQNLAVKVTGPFGDVPAEQKDNSDGTHSVSYKPLDVGSYKVEITVDDQAVADSPYTVEAHAPEGAAWHENSYAEGPGLEDGNTTAEPTHYTIYTVDKDGNPCTKGGAPIDVEIMGPECEPVDADVKDNEDGTYTVTYHPTEAGEYTIENVLRNPFQPMHFEHIKNSPKTVQVVPGTDPSASYAYGPGLENDILDTLPTEFFIQAADKDGNKMDKGGDPFEVDIKDADGNNVPFDLTDNEDGTYKVAYKPNGPGEQKVNVNLRGKPIKDAPFTLSIKAGASAFSVVEDYTFTIQAKTAAGENRMEGGEDFQITIEGEEGPVDTVKVKDKGNGRYRVTYSLPDPTKQYTISATINGNHIVGSPWKHAA